MIKAPHAAASDGADPALILARGDVLCASPQEASGLSVLAVALSDHARWRATPWPFAAAELRAKAFEALIGHALQRGRVDEQGCSGVVEWHVRTVAWTPSPAGDATGTAAATLHQLPLDAGPEAADRLLVVLVATDAHAAAVPLAYRHAHLDRVGATAYAFARGPHVVVAFRAARHRRTGLAPGSEGLGGWRRVQVPAERPARRAPDQGLSWPADIDR